MSQRTAHPARGPHRHARLLPPPHAHPRATPPPQDEEQPLTTLDAAADEPVAIDLSERMIDREATWRDVFRGPWVGEDASDARAEVDRFLRDHFATDELEIA